MILVADSGSTKTDWALLTRSGQTSRYQTEGINPVLMSEEQIRNILSNSLLPQMAKVLWVGTIDEIYFYGAGCTPEKKIIVQSALQSVFRKAQVVSVESDMLGAARALFGKTEGIACILGTGSNSCHYDGEKFIKNVPALGFILGDEGSGAALGKRLVADLLKNQLSGDLKQKFLEQYSTSQADIIEHVYRQPMPNRYLAHFAPFVLENIDNELIYKLAYSHFEQFVVRNLKQYPTLPVGFVGSIAYYFSDILSLVLADNGLPLAQIMKSPIEGIIDFHSYKNE